MWACTSTNKLHSLMIIQKRAIRICTLSQPRDHSAPLFSKLHTLTLSDINKFQIGIFMYKFTNNLLPRTSSSFTSITDIHNHFTRSHNNLFVPFARRTYSYNTMRYYGPRLWNSTRQFIKTQSFLGRFKKSYRKLLVSHYVT